MKRWQCGQEKTTGHFNGMGCVLIVKYGNPETPQHMNLVTTSDGRKWWYVDGVWTEEV